MPMVTGQFSFVIEQGYMHIRVTESLQAAVSFIRVNLANLFCRIVLEGVPTVPQQNSFAGRHIRNCR